jgi:hypothetical protein
MASASWTAEGIGYTPSDETFANVSLGAYKSTAKIIVSEELVEDSPVRAGGVPRDASSVSASAFCRTRRSCSATVPASRPAPVVQRRRRTSRPVTAATGAGNTTSFSYSALVSAIFALPRQYRATRRSSSTTPAPATCT